MQELRIVGHRGNIAAAPENTIEGFHQCLIDKRVGGIELDIWNNDNGLIPVIHDKDVSITTNGKGSISTMSASQIALLRCRFGNKVTEEGVPYLGDVFALVDGTHRDDFLVNIEIKADAADGDADNTGETSFENRIGKLIRAFPKLKILITSFDHRRVINMKKLFPKLNTGFLQVGITAPGTLQAYTKEFGFGWWNLNHAMVSPAVVKAANEVGARVAAWTANDAEEWKRLINCGVHAIITNKPLELANYLDRKPTSAACCDHK